MTNKENKTTVSTTSPSQPKMKNTTLTVKNIQKQAKKMEQMSTYVLDTDYETNTNTIIKYYEEFSQTKIDSLLQEAYINIDEAKKEGITFFQEDDIDANFLFYITFLTAVRFTSLDKDVPSSISEQMPIMMDMYNKGLLSRIHDEVLDQSEVAKITDKLTQYQTLVSKVMDFEALTREDMINSVQNPEILNYGKTNSDVIHPLVNPESNLVH